MLFAIHIKLGDTNLYSKPFVFNQNNGSFISQMLRDIDFSFLIKKDQNFTLNIIEYSTKNDFYEFNKNNKECPDTIKLATYNLVFDEALDKCCTDEFEKGIFKRVLDQNNDVVLIFTVIRRKNEDDYIFSTPLITGNNSFFRI